MLMRILVVSLAMLLGSGLLGFRTLVAQTEVSRASLKQLLTIGWDTKPAARQAADDLYRDYVEQNPGDRQAFYAMALVKMQQGRFPDAAELVDRGARWATGHRVTLPRSTLKVHAVRRRIQSGRFAGPPPFFECGTHPRSRRFMLIGILKDTAPGERRVALTPEAVVVRRSERVVDCDP